MKIRIWCKGISKNLNFNTARWINPDDFILNKYYPRLSSLQEERNFIIQEFTGIVDSEGQEIFEGDIVQEERDLDKDCMYGDETTYLKNCIVVKQSGFFSHDNDDPFDLIMRTYKGRNPYVKVIGNIFENPELIDINDLI
jgi:uncharacterized phage protein (TIGR01671 family)